jgi:hypothetical protein
MRSRLGLALLLLSGCTPEGSGTGPTPPREAAPPASRHSPTPSRAPAPGPGGQDFAAEARLLFRVAACGGEAPLPSGLDAGVVEQHCRWLGEKIDEYRTGYLAGAEPFLAKLRPEGLPATVVYPFGGGDLLSALVTYPEATEITTLSLEHAGDPRRLSGLDTERLAASLALLRESLEGVLTLANSSSESLSGMEKAELPGQLCFFLVALRVHGYEPAGLRFFRIEPDGRLHYLAAPDLAAVDASASGAFSNAELLYRTAGRGEGPPRVHRHIAANLADRALKADERVLKHLEAKGTVAAMTQAASYTLWNPGFARIRSYLLGHMAFMVSDSTGIPPRFANEAGFVQETYGRFTAPLLDANREIGEEFAALWKEQPQRELPFRYGYLDARKQFHLLVTRRAQDQKDAGRPPAGTEQGEPEEGGPGP